MKNTYLGETPLFGMQEEGYCNKCQYFGTAFSPRRHLIYDLWWHEAGPYSQFIIRWGDYGSDYSVYKWNDSYPEHYEGVVEVLRERLIKNHERKYHG